MALETTAESPVPVRTVSTAIVEWVGRLGAIWVEGQVAQITRRPGTRQSWIVLRDTDVDMSLSVVVSNDVLDSVTPTVAEGHRIVVFAKPEVYPTRGQLQLRARQIRTVGLGALLAEIERLRGLLAAEGLFAAERKRRLPFLPARVGLICGRASAAMRDVMVNASARWPAVEFEVREVAVQGPSCVSEVVAALTELDRMPEVDVIVITRGGGSVEDLLPFSNERMVRAVSQCVTPVVSAIGHEQDAPLVDLVADLRASTPTDAAKRIVPDIDEQRALIAGLRDRAYRCVDAKVAADSRWLSDVRDRSVLRDPAVGLLTFRQSDVDDLRARIVRTTAHRLDRAQDDLSHVLARVRALSPAATLERGYAIVTRGDRVVRDEAEVGGGEQVEVRVAHGSFSASRLP